LLSLAWRVTGAADELSLPSSCRIDGTLEPARKVVDSFGSPELFMQALENFLNDGADEFYTAVREADFFEDLSVLVRKRSIDRGAT